MRDEIRDRFFTPFVLPVTIIGVLLLIGLSLSRILLAIPEYGSALVALLAAGYILAMAFLVEARKRITARALGVALAVGFIGLVAAGAVAAAAGMRPLEEEGGGTAGGGQGGGQASNKPVFVAVDIDYQSAPQTLPSGKVDLTLDNEGTIEHTVVFEELDDEVVLDAAGGETDENSVTLEPGKYTYYCDVPGHRAAGMEGTLTVTDEAAAGGGGGGDGGSGGASEAGSEATSEQPSDGATGGASGR